MERREFIGTLASGLLAVPLTAEAQQAAKVARVGILGANPAASPRLEGFLQGLRDLGYVEGRNVVMEYRNHEGKVERLPALAAELVRSRLMSSWPQTQAPPWPPSKRPGPSPLSSLLLPIRLRAGSSPALRGRAAMSRECPLLPRS
jgi:hypothetical protein